MKREIAWLGLLLGLVLGACAKTTEPLQDKNTNWLRSCSADVDCGGELFCLCGLCTQPCGSSAQCGEDDGASCVEVADSALAPQCTRKDMRAAVAVCAASCERAGDCAGVGEDMACREGICVTQGSAFVPDERDPDQPPDAGSQVDASTEGSGATSSADLAPCSGGAAGACVVLDGLATPSSAAISGALLYWTNRGTYDALGNDRKDGSVMALPLAGGEPVVLAGNQDDPHSLVIETDHAYWLNKSWLNPRNRDDQRDGALMRVALSGGAPEKVLGDLANSEGLAVDAEHAYFFVHYAPDSIIRMRKNGSGRFGLIVDRVTSFRGSLLHSEGSLYWKSDFQLRGLVLNPQGPVRMLSNIEDSSGSGGQLVLAGDTFYWTWEGADGCGLSSIGVYGASAWKLMSYPGGSMPAGLAVDASHVYWSLNRPIIPGLNHWVVARTDRASGETVTLLEGPDIAHPMLALSADALYVITRGSADGKSALGKIIRIPK